MNETEEEDDLRGMQLVFLLVFFGAAGGLLYLISWLARPNFLYDRPYLCFALAGGLCYPARYLVERFDWWNRLEQRRRARPPRKGAGTAMRVIRVLIGVPIALLGVAAVPLGIQSSRADERLAAAGPVVTAQVIAIESDRWSEAEHVTVKIARPGDGISVELSDGDLIEPLPAVGDQVNVVVDPDDPSYVLAVDVDRSWSWWEYPLIGLVALFTLAVGLWIAFP
ncbi:hypothetical protein HPO96_07210 [Kribbella sandramycini]|uniref:Uncharacterized protein n=1 Tax=Kribbella sandramycini TaxID=60450 RepID=A0A7Y4KWM1_9ACTN|nr:DUF3592 domain-containing protein [Kribbella sandramycini]MBB6567359.1 hypothetical protein [Kribbella sandramycini]NOL40028.1 hypothetical protein [Kribbella sandramycini]